jgi:hypothetical protein
MGDTRFDRAWADWESLAGDARVAFLRSTDVATLIALLASGQAAKDPYRRNVIASALANRVETHGQEPQGLPEQLVDAEMASVQESVVRSRLLAQTGREMAASTREMIQRRREPSGQASDRGV